MLRNELLNRVEDAINQFEHPVSTNDISFSLDLSKATILNALKELVNQGRIEIIYEGTGRYYQILKGQKEDGISKLDERFAQLDDALTEKNKKTVERIEQAEKEISNIYANMISIMGVFVSIFSLIIINANAGSDIVSKAASMKEAIINLLILNLPVTICIIVLLLGIRWIILRDFRRGARK